LIQIIADNFFWEILNSLWRYWYFPNFISFCV